MEIFQKGYYAAPVDETAVRRHWSADGYSFGVFNDPPDQEWNDFVHATNEYVAVSEGELRISVGDESYLAGPGDLVFIPKGVRHSLKTLSASGSRWLYGYD